LVCLSNKIFPWLKRINLTFNDDLSEFIGTFYGTHKGKTKTVLKQML